MGPDLGVNLAARRAVPVRHARGGGVQEIAHLEQHLLRRRAVPIHSARGVRSLDSCIFPVSERYLYSARRRESCSRAAGGAVPSSAAAENGDDGAVGEDE